MKTASDYTYHRSLTFADGWDVTDATGQFLGTVRRLSRRQWQIVGYLNVRATSRELAASALHLLRLEEG